jgi:hypothetical protein
MPLSIFGGGFYFYLPPLTKVREDHLTFFWTSVQAISYAKPLTLTLSGRSRPQVQGFISVWRRERSAMHLPHVDLQWLLNLHAMLGIAQAIIIEVLLFIQLCLRLTRQK